MRLAYVIIFSGIIAAMAACAVIAMRSGKQNGKAVGVLLLSLIMPMAGNGIIIQSTERLVSLIGCYMYYLGLDMAIAALVHFTKEYCRMSWRRKTYRNLVFGALLADVIQMLLNPVFGHAFEVTEIEVEGLPYYRMIPHLGQAFHRAVDYLLLAGIIAVFVIRVVRAPRFLRERYLIILFALLAVSAWETVYVFSGTPIDRSMIGLGVLGLLIFYFSEYYRPMRLLDRMLSGVVSGQADPMYFFDSNQKCIWMNAAGRAFLGLEEQETDRAGELLEKTFGSRHEGETQWRDQLQLNRDGESRFLELGKEPLLDSEGKLNGFYVRVHDLTAEQAESAEKLYNARHDSLTGVYTRDFLYERTRELLAANPEESYLVINAEISDLKVINDLYGKAFGDIVLKAAAGWLQADGHLQPGTVYGRLGGDSFGVCIPEKDFDQKRLEKNLSEFTVRDGGQDYRPLVHMGIYRITDRSLEVSVIYDRAMLAMESIKDDYHFHVAWYDESMRDTAVWNRQVSGELPGALEQGLLRPWLQPIVDREGKTVGAEALVRWIHPEDGIRAPLSFIPVFEQNGMIAEVDRHIWREACGILARWKREGKDLFLSVNISRKDFYLMNVPSELMKLVLEYNVDPGKLRLEITESVMMDDQETRIGILRKLQDAGFIIEMDDFGSGYSSLNLLREMPVDVVKIDMAFLRQAGRNPRAKAIIRHVIAMAKDLGVTSLTEGVETPEQFEVLREMGCEMYQGYYFAKPMPVEEFDRGPGKR